MIGAFLEPRQFFQSYLFSFSFWSQIPLGALALFSIGSMTGARWVNLIKRPIKAAILTLPATVLTFIPNFFGLNEIYPWWQGVSGGDSGYHFKEIYYHPLFFILRSLVYLISWLFISNISIVNRIENRQKWSSIALILFAVTITFSSIDWLMSIEYHWKSTAYGPIFMMADALSALSFIGVYLLVKSKTSRTLAGLGQHDSELSWMAIGNVLLVCLLGWVYLSLMQYMVYWSSDLPHQVTWYLTRVSHGWEILLAGLAIFHVAIPFSALLFRNLKADLNFLGTICMLIFFFRVIDVYWYVTPAFYQDGFHFSVLDLTTFLAIGGIWMTVFIWNLDSPLPLSQAEDQIPL